MIQFSDVTEAEQHASELESDQKAINWALENKAFEDAYTENAMRRMLAEIGEQLDELYTLINQVKYPLL